jgi:succinyl-diaminopimelate desuccinylase
MSPRIRNELARKVDASLDRLIEVTQRLVAVASPNPPSDTFDVAQVAEALLREIPGIEIERVEPEPRIVSLIGRIRGRGPGRRLIFNGHLDTFPLLENLPWTVPPLGGVPARCWPPCCWRRTATPGTARSC